MIKLVKNHVNIAQNPLISQNTQNVHDNAHASQRTKKKPLHFLIISTCKWHPKGHPFFRISFAIPI